MKRILIALLCACLAVSLSACGGREAENAAALSFRDAVKLENLEKLNGQTVSIVGYMATVSPISGRFMYLMNMPYQSCPFCVPNTTELANTMAVYAPEGKAFDYTDQAVRVTGTLVIRDMTDEFGYIYNYYIADASYTCVDLSDISESHTLWQALASDGIVAELNEMFDYLYFLTAWTEYQGGYIDEAGAEITYFFYPGDVYQYLEDASAYGYKDKYDPDYFPALVRRIRAVSPDGLEELVGIVERAGKHAAAALAELHGGRYTYDEAADKYTLNAFEDLEAGFYEVYYAFSDWLTRWEL